MLSSDCLLFLADKGAATLPMLQSSSIVRYVLMMCFLESIFVGILVCLCHRFLKNVEKTIRIKSIVVLSANLLGFSGLILLDGICMETIKYMFLLLVLSHASIVDIKCHEIDDYISAMIIMLSFVGIQVEDVPKVLIGFFATLVFLIIVSLVFMKTGKSMGGADIKISASLSCFFGLRLGIYALMLGTILSCIVMFVLILLKKHEKGKPYALIPFINIGTLLVLLLCI